MSAQSESSAGALSSGSANAAGPSGGDPVKTRTAERHSAGGTNPVAVSRRKNAERAAAAVAVGAVGAVPSAAAARPARSARLAHSCSDGGVMEMNYKRFNRTRATVFAHV